MTMAAADEHPEILLAVAEEWQTAAQIHRAVGVWSFSTVRQVLNRMAAQGAIEGELRVIDPQKSARFYRARRR